MSDTGSAAALYPFFYRVRKWRPEWHGLRCRIVARGARNSRLVEFADGRREVVSGNALRKVKPKAT